METVWTEELLLRCCWSKRFAKEMVAASPFPDYDRAVESARHIWFNKIDVNGWLEAFAAHPQIGGASSSVSQWSKEEQSTAAATAHDSTLRELAEWNARYREKFGFVFLICATGRSTQEILAELKKRYPNRPIVELEVAAIEKMKIIELQLARLFKFDALSNPSGTTQLGFVNPSIKAGELKLHSGNHQRLMNTLTSKIKAHWTPEFHKLFVTLCLDQVVAGNKPGTHLNKKGWKYVMDKFYERTGIQYDKKQFQNHWDSTKDQWKVWNKLKSDLAGYEFDTNSQTINMSDDWWANYIQMHPEATQFRQKGLPLADLLDILFSGARTGVSMAPTPLQSSMPNSGVKPCPPIKNPETNHVALEFVPETWARHQELPALFQDDFDTRPPSQRKRTSEDVLITTREKKGVEYLGLDNEDQHRSHAVESRSTATSALREDYSIKECINLLNEISGIQQGSELYMFALDLFLRKEYRELFIALSLPSMQYAWLHRQQKISKINHQSL